MYIILSEGKPLRYVEELPYVKLEDGIYVRCPQTEADALSVGGTLYSVTGKEPVQWPVIAENEDGEEVLTGETVDAPKLDVVERAEQDILQRNWDILSALQGTVDGNSELVEELLLDIDATYSALFETLSDAILELDARSSEAV